MTIANTKHDADGNRISSRTGKPVRQYNKNPAVKNRHSQLTQNALSNLPPGENTRYITHIQAIMEIAQGVDTHDIESLKERFVRYLELCARTDMKVGNLAAYAAMGITKADVFDWEHGRGRRTQPEFKAFAIFVKSVIAAYRESAIQNGEINPIVGIFWQKSFDGLNEMTEVEASNATESATEQLDAQQIAEKYQDLLPE